MKNKLYRRALNLSIFTLTYNIIEGIVSVIAGVMAGSIALIGFGLDSFVESLSGGVMVWRFARHDQMTQEQEERIEQQAEKFVGITFFILGAYVLWEAIGKLVKHEAPEHSLVGIIIAIASLIVMPLLARAKYRTGKELGSGALIADSKETIACCWLSAALLIGLSLNWLAGLWWADPVAALVVVIFLFREGYELVTGGCGCEDDENSCGSACCDDCDADK